MLTVGAWLPYHDTHSRMQPITLLLFVVKIISQRVPSLLYICNNIVHLPHNNIATVPPVILNEVVSKLRERESCSGKTMFFFNELYGKQRERDSPFYIICDMSSIRCLCSVLLFLVKSHLSSQVQVM